MSVASASKIPSLAQAFAEELRQLKGRSERTAEAYGHVATRFLENCDGKPQAGDARSFIAEAAKHLAPASQAQWVSALRELLRWGARRGHWEAGLERGLMRPKTPRKLIRVLDEEDLPLLLKAVGQRPENEQLLFELLYGSGLRISEALRARAEHLRPGPSLFVLGKGARGREVPVSDKAARHLKELDRGAGPWPARSSARSLRHWVQNWGKSALLADNEGLLHPHKLRHSIATHLLRRGAKLPQLQKLLGHQQLGTTERYTHLDPADLLQAYDASFPKKMVKK